MNTMTTLAVTSLTAALCPPPIDLTSIRKTDPRRDVRIIKHSIKMSGMPAWGKSMGVEKWSGMTTMHAQSRRTHVHSSDGHVHAPAEGHAHSRRTHVHSSDGHVHAPAEGHAHSHDTDQ